MTTAYSYIRFSTKPQEMGRSKARQAEATAAYCARHGMKLSSQNFADLGVSAWKGKNAHEGALAAFLKAMQSGRIAKGSVLIVESLDRISRQAALKALRALEQIIEAGIDVITLSPERRYNARSLDETFSLFEMMLIFVRANEESETKSRRIKDVWRNRRAKGLVTSGRGPGWLIYVNDSWKLDKAKVAVVRKIIQLSADGHGASAILKYLHANKIENPASGKPRWSLAYVQLLLRDRRLIGELQPCEYVDGKRQPVGEPLVDYYPAAVPLALFARAQAALAARKRNSNTKVGNTVNLFAGLLVDPVTDGKWVCGKKASHKPARLMLLAARNQEVKSLSADYEEVEKAVLAYLSDLDLEALLPRETEADDIRGKLEDATQRIAAISQQIESEDPDNVQPLLKLLVKLEKERKALAAAHNENAAQQHAAGSAQGVIERMRKATGETRRNLRLQLRTHLASVITRIDMRVVPYWKWSVAVLDIHLVNGVRRREVTHIDLLPKELRNELLLDADNPVEADALAIQNSASLPLLPLDRVRIDQQGTVSIEMTSSAVRKRKGDSASRLKH